MDPQVPALDVTPEMRTRAPFCEASGSPAAQSRKSKLSSIRVTWLESEMVLTAVTMTMMLVMAVTTTTKMMVVVTMTTVCLH